METIISLCKFIHQVLSTHCPPVLKLTRALRCLRSGGATGSLPIICEMPAGGGKAVPHPHWACIL